MIDENENSEEEMEISGENGVKCESVDEEKKRKEKKGALLWRLLQKQREWTG